ncbi:hypothetical protein [Lentibacillus amyloliquefaciens]|uniref:SPOR domain-containing protein n=1 Tax=Lentibacillus amyloliquefaciens TaxID=1472767 RepID=A0A0U3W4V5_9BACI|nr:hypothetical protein [Lentibacillus amyloliquefaciens]ALX48210.1 hypothetical protein AOX59_06065 [Lentibacillus amyloliquefaciens]
MSNDEKIEVWKNGKKKTITQDDTEAKEKDSIKNYSDEQAGTIEDSDIPELIREHNDDSDSENKIHFTRKSRLKAFKPFIIAALSAIVIGSVLGFFMLNMFGDINDNISLQGNSSSLAAAGDEDDQAASGESNDKSLVTIDSGNAFVLQAGKFSEKENAEQMQAAFEEQGFPSMIWEKGEYFFVLTGIADSEGRGTQLSGAYAEKNLEVYVKEWTTASAEIELTDKEKEWLQTYDQQWNDSLASISNDEKISQEQWANVIDSMPENSERLAEFTHFLSEQHNQMAKADKWQSHVILLQLWERAHKLTVQ